jgi:hypothetical protein
VVAKTKQLVLNNFTGEGVGVTFSRTTDDVEVNAIGTATSAWDMGLFARESIIFATGGGGTYSQTTEQARLTSTGLGIGTSSPGAKLDVAGAARPSNATYKGDIIIQQSGTALAGTGGLEIVVDSGGSGYGARIQSTFNGSSAYDLSFQLRNNSASWTQRMLLDSSGNLGLGVTPSAWGNGWPALQVFRAVMHSNTSDGRASFGNNYYVDGTNAIYIATAAATQLMQVSGEFRFFNAPSGTAGNAITFTQAMTLDASGNLLVGGTSALQSAKLTAYGSVAAQNNGVDGTFANAFVGVYSGNSNEHNVIQTAVSSDGTGSGFRFKASNGGGSSATTTVLDLTRTQTIFYTGGSERARITSGGYSKFSNDGTYVSAAGSYHEFRSNEATNFCVDIGSTSASFTAGGVVLIRANRNTTNNTFYALSYYNDAAGAFKFRVADSGDVTNTNGTYGTISDAKMKADIVDAGSQWADIKALRFRKFKMKDDPSGLVQLGVVAQEVELTSPGLVDEHQDRDAEGNDLGTTTKSVKTSVLLMKAAVALQEAMSRIEALEAQVAQLKGA